MFFFFEDNTVPSFEQMIKPVLVALQQLGGSAKLKELDSKAIEIMNLPKEIVEIPHKGSTNRGEVAYRFYEIGLNYVMNFRLVKNMQK